MFWPEWGVLASLRLCIASKRLLPEVFSDSVFDFSSGQLELHDSLLYVCVKVREKERVNKARQTKKQKRGSVSHIHTQKSRVRQTERERPRHAKECVSDRNEEKEWNREREEWTERFSKLALHEKCFDIRSVTVYLFYIVCVCVCVCVGEREKEKEREKESIFEYVAGVVRP